MDTIVMEYLPIKWVEVKGQKFDIGRTINPMQCCGCQDRNCMACPNYAKQMKKGSYSIKEWVAAFKGKLTLWNQNSFNQFFDSLIVKFPKGLYWDYDHYSNSIRFVSITRNGNERVMCTLNRHLMIADTDDDLSETRRKFIEKVIKTMRDVEKEFKGE